MDWLLERFASAREVDAFIHEGRRVTYGELLDTVEGFSRALAARGVAPGETVAILADYSPEVFAFLLALAQNRNILVPLTRESVIEKEAALGISGCHWFATFSEDGKTVDLTQDVVRVHNTLLSNFLAAGAPGLIMFSSGSTGRPKGILHDLWRVAEKFRVQRDRIVAICFLALDHFGGINTILAITSSLGTVVTVRERSVASICSAIEAYRVQVLPTTPSFLTMLVSSNLAKEHDLSSLERITYGTEVMPQSTLDRLRRVFPGVRLQQTYGLSELGVLRSRSRDDGSLWVRIGGEGFQTKVVDGILWVKSSYRMVGYLNAPSDFDEDGWFNTQDRVEVDGDYFRILGRVTDLINVGGKKVYPAEIEDVVIGLDNIVDAAAYGEANPLLGQMIVVKVLLDQPEPLHELKKRIRKACGERLAAFKVPAKVVLATGSLETRRFKKNRRADAPEVP